jgi:hypothetical protein
VVPSFAKPAKLGQPQFVWCWQRCASPFPTSLRRLISGEIKQHDIRAFLHSFEDDFTAVWGDVEGLNIEVGRKVRQLPLIASVEVDEPEILVLHLSSQEHESPSAVQE